MNREGLCSLDTAVREEQGEFRVVLGLVPTSANQRKSKVAPFGKTKGITLRQSLGSARHRRSILRQSLGRARPRDINCGARKPTLGVPQSPHSSVRCYKTAHEKFEKFDLIRILNGIPKFLTQGFGKSGIILLQIFYDFTLFEE